MQFLYQFFKWAFGAWLLAAVFVLAWCAMRAGPVAVGEAAFIMFFLGLPASVPVGTLMSTFHYPGFHYPNDGGWLQVVMVWAPYFVGVLIQGGILLGVLRYLATGRNTCRSRVSSS